MAILNGTEQTIQRGIYNIQVVIGGGTADIQYSTDELDFGTIDGANYTASGGDNYNLPRCKVKAVLTGDAQVSINRINN